MKKFSKVKRYIPKLVLEWIQKTDFKNKDHLVIICDMITRISVYRGIKKNDWGESDYSNSYTDIPGSYFTNIISNKISFKESMEFLKQNQIVLCDGIYSKISGKSLGYKFDDKWISKLESWIIQKDLISKKIANNKNERGDNTPEWLINNKKHFIKNFKIDYDNSKNWLESQYLEKSRKLEPSDKSGHLELVMWYNCHLININSINDGDLFFRRNDTNNRIDTNLTNLRSELRQFIKYPSKLVQIDICNSQPFFLSCILKNGLGSWRPNPTSKQSRSVDTVRKNQLFSLLHSWTLSLCSTFLNEKTLKSFIDVVCRGFLYDQIISVYKREKNINLTRKQAKIIMFRILYSKPESFRNERKMLNMVIPDVLKVVDGMKVRNYKDVAIVLQVLESSFCIDTIIPLFEINSIKCYTIHDSWIIESDNLESAKKIIENEFISSFGIKPELSISNI